MRSNQNTKAQEGRENRSMGKKRAGNNGQLTILIRSQQAGGRAEGGNSSM